MLNFLLKRIFGSRNQRIIKQLIPVVERINQIEVQYQSLSDEQLIAKTAEFKDRYSKGETLDDLLPEAFAVVKNTARRFTQHKRQVIVRGHPVLWEMIHFDVQLIGGMVLHQGKIAEMATGEGKTLVATCPVYLNALTGKGVHIVTVNDYLAARDSEWMGEVYKFLGLTVGCLQHDQNPTVRRAQYVCDITYGTNSEYGFDYLRDNGMASSREEQVQRGHVYAIVDEVDSILIDEARTPLIISGPAVVASTTQNYEKYKGSVSDLVKQQNILCNRMISDARKLLDEHQDDEAGRLLFQVKQGMPTHKQFLKLMEEPEFLKLAERTETELYADTRKQEMHDLKEALYFIIDEKGSNADLTEKGRNYLNPTDPDAYSLPDLVEQFEKIDSDPALIPQDQELKKQQLQREFDEKSDRIHAISQLLRAYCVFEKDVHYVIQENKVQIVDEFTGRILPGRRWSDGLHQAVEAKEGVAVEKENQTLATITIQNYFRLYEKLAGMTGTAETEAQEFFDIYKLEVVVIPTNKPVARKDLNDVIYKTKREKFNAIVKEVKASNQKGQPVLVGTVSVETSELLSRMFKREGLIHSVLNAKYHQQEAEIVANAGRRGAITIATNMAGRGTDIKLSPGVPEAGGLYVIGTERHEARRIDRQLRGRCARQGDPGQSRFFLALDDDLMRKFASGRIASIMEKVGMEEGQELEHPLLNRSIETAQKRVEQHNFTIRKHTLEYDDVMNKQREIIYGWRTEIINSDNVREMIFDTVGEVVEKKVDEYITKGKAGYEANLDSLTHWVNATFPIGVRLDDLKNLTQKPEAIKELILEKVRAAYLAKEQHEIPEAIKGLERYILLNAIDRLWQEHLYAMDSLRTSISLRSYGQKDPLVEYKSEAYLLFTELMENIKSEIVNNLFRSATSLAAFENFLRALPKTFMKPDAQQAGQAPSTARTGSGSGTSSVSVSFSGGEQDEGGSDVVSEAIKSTPVRRDYPKVGRNDPCPCGSGQKYKKCHGKDL